MYLASYMCKPEHTMSEVMKKVHKETHEAGNNIKDQFRPVAKVLRECREVSTHEACVRLLSLPLRTSEISVIYIPVGEKKNRTRMLKDKKVYTFY